MLFLPSYACTSKSLVSLLGYPSLFLLHIVLACSAAAYYSADLAIVRRCPTRTFRYIWLLALWCAPPRDGHRSRRAAALTEGEYYDKDTILDRRGYGSAGVESVPAPDDHGDVCADDEPHTADEGGRNTHRARPDRLMGLARVGGLTGADRSEAAY
jgi:hypothetical protein